MMIEKKNYLGFEIDLIYQPFFDNSTPRSRQYKLIIKKYGLEFVNKYGFTYSGAKTFYKRWIDNYLRKLETR